MRTRTHSNKAFCYPWWGSALAGVGAVLFSAGAWYTIRTGAEWWLIAIYALMALLSILGFVGALMTRIELREEELRVRSGLSREVYHRSQLVEVTWAKGVPVSVKTQDGVWVELPSVAAGSQSLANSLRAWMRRGKGEDAA
jgi:hypothetical protein